MPERKQGFARSVSPSLRLVDTDEVGDERAEIAASGVDHDVADMSAAPEYVDVERQLLTAIAERDEERRRAERAELEVLSLRARVSELESWSAERVGFEEREQLQLDRLLTAHAAERAERRGRFLSARLVLLALYVVSAAGFAWLLLAEQV